MEQVGSKVKVIERIIILSRHDRTYEVGLICESGRYVAEIKDYGCEWENGIDFIYRVYDENGDQIASIENCPVIVEYFAPVIETDYTVLSVELEDEKLPF